MNEEFYVKILDDFVGLTAPWSVPARVWPGPAETAPACVREDPNPNGYRKAIFVDELTKLPTSPWGKGALADIAHLRNSIKEQQVDRLKMQSQYQELQYEFQQQTAAWLAERNAAWEECETLKAQLELAQLRIDESERYRGERDVLIGVIKQIRESVSHL